ncbi:MAG TPA: ubiquinol-cytochrome c reductase iron-sulfur subunit [Chloroflexota bacterium]
MQVDIVTGAIVGGVLLVVVLIVISTALRAGRLPEPEKQRVESRRTLLRRAGWGVIFLVLAEFAVGFLPFFWPKRVGAFGGTVRAGKVTDYNVGDVRKIVEGKFYVVRVPEGFVALWQKCPHLGCAVPWKPLDPSEDTIASSGRFNCPCHSSIYDRYGQIITGPAPRPMDRFPLRILPDGTIEVETGPDKAIQRASVASDPAGNKGAVSA